MQVPSSQACMFIKRSRSGSNQSWVLVLDARCQCCWLTENHWSSTHPSPQPKSASPIGRVLPRINLRQNCRHRCLCANPAINQLVEQVNPESSYLWCHHWNFESSNTRTRHTKKPILLHEIGIRCICKRTATGCHCTLCRRYGLDEGRSWQCKNDIQGRPSFVSAIDISGNLP